MTPMVHLLLLPLLFSVAGGIGLEDKKGPFKDTELTVQEETPVPFAIFQFEVAQGGVNSFRLSGDDSDAIKISKDGWLYLDTPLKWSEKNIYNIKVEALADDVVVEGPINVAITVLDINNNAPYFDQSVYSATVKENNPAGVPFTSVSASDQDDPKTPNAHLMYSLVSQTPSRQSTPLFQIDPNTGEISTTKEGEKMLKARDAFQYGRGEDQGIDALKTRFNDYCPGQKIPFEENPFFACVQKSEMRRQNVDPLNDPDYTLFVRVQDQGGATQTALSGNTRVQIVIKQNLWVNPGPILVRENLKAAYPHLIAKVQSNDPNAVYRLVQKERELKFPFQITVDGEIQLTEELDREEKGQYILVVLAEDEHHNQVDPPMEILVIVEDVNDNAPVCEESIFEVQEDEPAGSLVNTLVARDDDQEGTANSLLIYTIESQDSSTAFSIDAASGEIKTLRSLRRKDQQVYNLNVKVNDPVFSTVCKVVIKVIDVNNEIPKFEKNDYGSLTLEEDAPLGHTVLTIKATDADDPDSGSSHINFEISGDHDGVFSVETDGKGVGHVVIAKPLDFESTSTYNLQINARNPEPLMKGMEYGIESTASVSVSVTDVDEAPEFSLDILDVTVPENTTKGAVLLTVGAKDPEGKEISFKLDGDTQGWLEINAATGEIKTKGKLDRETLETFEVTVIAFEKEHPEKSSERTLSVRLLDVNDNVPKLMEKQAFICVKKPEPVIIKAYDTDSAPFAQPFSFTLAHGKKSPNWNLHVVDGTTAKLIMKKPPTEEKIFHIPVTIKDNAGMGITHLFEVRVCNCTVLGYCYIPPLEHGFKLGMGPTIGILAGTIGFCIIAFIIAVKRSNKEGKGTGEEAPMMT